MYILALNGSHNNDGNTAFLLNEILRHCAEKGAETEICSVSEAILDTKTPFCVACSTPCTKKCYKDTKLDTLFDKIERASAGPSGSSDRICHTYNYLTVNKVSIATETLRAAACP